MADLIAGKYEVLGKIGQGGMGTVYKVRHTVLDSVFALKVLPDISADNPELVGRFQREARIMAKLKHDNIVRVFELAHERDVHCLVMDFIDGPTLAQHMRTVGLLSSLDALEIARQVGRALAYAHSRGVVHRDVKPSNVLIESTDPMRVLLSDFGIAKVEDSGERTRTGSLLGSLRYSAPEQLSGEDVARIDARADIFALGLVIYELFEGKAFHANRGEGEIYRRMLYDSAPLAPEFSRPVPPGVAALVSRAIQRDPADRFPTTPDLLKAIDRCIATLDEGDEEKTRLVARGPRDLVDDATHDDVSDDELDQRLRALEVERQRRLVRSSRARVDAARERARAARGQELAATSYEQAAAHETEASAALEHSQYLKARDLLEEAARLFTEAETAAAAARLAQETDAARAAMRAARTSAEDVHAEGEARTLYARALAVEAEADAHLGRRSFTDAQRGYTDAGRLFGEARDEARRRRQEVVERARSAMTEARRLAQSAGADEHAATLFRRGATRAEEAATASQRDEWETASALFEEAGRTFGQAVAEAATRRAAAERNAMLAAKTAAERAGALAHAAAPWARATAREAEAERHLAANTHADAVEAFADARRLFEESGALARRAQREAMDRARAESEAARKRADSAAADNLATEVYRRAAGAAEQADRAVAQDEYAKGRELAEEATRLFTKASVDAELAGRANAAQQAREAMRAAKQRAQRDGARGTGPGAAREAEAEAQLARRAFAEAERGFGEARAAYEKEGKEADAARRSAAESARDRARAAREAAAAGGADRQVPTVFREAQEQEKRGQSSFQSGELVQAAEQFATARGAYERAARDAQEVARQEAEKTRVEARKAVQAPADDATRLTRPGDVDATRLVPRGGRPSTSPTPDNDATVLQPAFDDATRILPVENPDATRLVARPSAAAAPSPTGVSGDPEATVYMPAAALRAGLAQQTRAQPEPKRTPVAPVKPRAEAAASPLPRYAAFGAAALVAVLAIYLLVGRRTPPVPEAPPTPLAWGRTMPLEKETVLAPGKSVWFGAEVQNAPAGTDVRYSWRIDGKERATGSSWEYAPEPAEAGKTREVTVVASVGQEQIERAWQVRVEGASRPPAEAVNRRPVVASVNPPVGSVALESGAKQVFAVTARDPDGGDVLTYSWEHNGRSAAEGAASSWTLQEAQDGDQVRVTVRDKGGLTAGSQEWRVAVAKPLAPPTPTPTPTLAPTAPPPVTANAPPRILGEVPPARKLVSVQEGGSVDFSLRVEDPDKGGPLAYAWFLDGHAVGQKTTWQFKAPSEGEAKAAHRVEAEVSDDGGLKAPRVAWDVEVTWAPPRIVEFSPRERQVVAAPGKPTRFNASARPGDGRSALTYEWVLDGQAAHRTPEGRFEVPGNISPGEHVLQLTSVDSRGLRSAPQRWTLELQKPDTAKVAPPRTEPPSPATEQVTDNDVRDWLGRYKAAWENKQVDALTRIGVVPAGQAETVRQALARYKKYSVSLRNESITLQGSRATVSFDRSDTDETGETMTHPKQTWRLEKHGTGVIAVGKGP